MARGVRVQTRQPDGSLVTRKILRTHDRIEQLEAEVERLKAVDRVLEIANADAQEVERLEKAATQDIEERDRANDALQATHIALGGDGEWCAKPGSVCLAGETGDLAIDVPVVAERLKADVQRLKDALASIEAWNLCAKFRRDYGSNGERDHFRSIARNALSCAALDAKEDVRAAVLEANQGRGADVVMVCAGVLPALKQAIECVDRGGTIVTFAVPPPGEDLPVPVNRFWRNSITLTTSYAGSPSDLVEAAALIERKVVPAAEMITHVLPLSRIGEGFGLVAAGGESIKVVVHPQE